MQRRFPADQLALDIGPETVERFRAVIGRRARRSSGTGRWACSRSPPFDAGTMAMAAAVADSARGQRRRRRRLGRRGDALRARRTISPTSRPVAGPRSSSSRVRPLPGLAALESALMARRTPAHRRQLEDALRGPPRRCRWSRRAARRWSRRCPTARCWWRRRSPPSGAVAHAPRRQPRPAGRAESALGGQGRLHRRGVGADAGGSRLHPRHRRPLGAAPALRRDRRLGGAQGRRPRCAPA